MHKKMKRSIICALVIAMMMSAGTLSVSTDDDADAVQTSASSAEEDTQNADSDSSTNDDDMPAKITDAQALKMCEKASEAGDLELWYDTENERVCLVDNSGSEPVYWWSSPINAIADDTILDSSARNPYMKDTQRQQLNSGLSLVYGDLAKRTTAPLYSGVSSRTRDTCTTEFAVTDKGVKITYNFRDGFIIPVEYTLNEGSLTVSCNTKEIVEENTSTENNGKVITSIQLAPQFGAAPATDLDGNKVEGYMIVPDGSGAVIEYNNGKSNYSSIYSQKIYGRNYTTVPLTAPKTTEQAYLPVAATVSGNHGLVAVATDGEADASVNAQVSGQNNQTYNTVYFDFEVRGTDDFYLSGESSALTVFEKGNITQERLAVTYYPLNSDKDINYADCAKVYRNYLINEKGMTSKVEENQANFYVDLYGGVIMQQSILGIPFDLKTSITSFEQAKTILSELSDKGVTDIVANYNDWTNKSIDGKIETNAKPSGTLGGRSDFDDLMSYAESSGIEIFPSLDNVEMNSSTWGYWTFTSTAVRVSNAYSRQSRYNPAFGVESGVAPALLSPTKYSEVFADIIDSYKDEELKNVGFGGYSTKLVSDYSSKNYSNRTDTMETIMKGYQDAQSSIGSVIADGANSYIIPYVDHITNIPVNSSGFNVVDFDIPFYQMVVHGYVPYATQAINGSSNSDETFLLAMAYGSSIHYDMLYEESSKLSDTDYDNLYYANYKGWIDTAAAESKAAKEILSQISQKVITNFEYDRENNIITTTYGSEDNTADESVVVVDLGKNEISVNGTQIDISEIVREGGSQG